MAIDISKAFAVENGLELGIGGPQILSDSGSPVGVYDPPAGSIYVDSSSLKVWKKISYPSPNSWLPFPNLTEVFIGEHVPENGYNYIVPEEYQYRLYNYGKVSGILTVDGIYVISE